MSRWISCLAIVLSISSTAYSAVSIGENCPEGRHPGDVWYPDGCQKCECSDGFYTCASCGVEEYDGAECYSDGYTDGVNPDCCSELIKCRGEDGFDESRMNN
ncbi:hypothetical protein Btru_076409 [Bulinus truncatus]|nr:hypothetical protein Btru_076409 [Bulinus truncatus]